MMTAVGKRPMVCNREQIFYLQLLFNLNRQRPSATSWLPFSRLRQFDVCLHEKGSAICPSRIT
jgi:hypothetical protein